MIQSDARDLRTLGIREGSVDCIVTSPPYWDLKRYATEGHEREIGHAERTYREYVEAVGAVLKDCLALAKPDGVLWLVADTLRGRGAKQGQQIPLPFDLAEEAERHGWHLQETIVWVKNKTLPYSGEGKLRNLLEYVLFFTRSRRFKHFPHRFSERHLPEAEWISGWPERYHPLGRRPSNVWHIPIPTQGMWSHSERLHFCPFPQELVARCIGLTTDKGDLVLDPFAGVGTVPAQAVAMGRRGIGVELNPENVRAFEHRTMPSFQATWESRAAVRAHARSDQHEEATLILKLRVLKAGKELMRLCERIANAAPSGHPSSLVESVVVRPVEELDELIDIEQGTVGRPTAHLSLVGHLTASQTAQLLQELVEPMKAQPFTGLSLAFRVVVEDPESLSASNERLLEFGQSRHGAFTAEPDDRLFPTKPKLLTTIDLGGPVQGGALSPLELARRKAERELLQREVSRGGTPSEISRRLGIHSTQLDILMRRHGLVTEQRSFAIPLPGQLRVDVDL